MMGAGKTTIGRQLARELKREFMDLDHELDCDVLVCGEKKEDKAVALQLCQDAGLRGVNAGALQNARAVEEMTAVLIAINIIHKVKSAGIRITGLEA